MPPLTKEELLALAESLEDGGSVTLFNQDELTEKLKARLAKEKDKQNQAISRIAQMQAELDDAKRQLEQTTQAAELEGKSELEKYQAELQRLQKAQETWTKRQAEAEARVAELQTARRQDHLQGWLRDTLASAGVVAKRLQDAADLARVRLANVLKITDSNGSYEIKAIDPGSLDELDPAQVIQAFVADRPEYQAPKPPGGGAPSAGPVKPPKPGDPMQGMTGSQRMEYAISKKWGQPVDLDDLPIVPPGGGLPQSE